jgi:hypothetical protein
MGISGYVSFCVQLYCVGFQCLSLHVSAYMAIFKCEGYFYFHMPEGFSFAGFFFALFQVVTLCTLQTQTQGNNKITEGKQHRKKTNGNVQSVTT